MCNSVTRVHVLFVCLFVTVLLFLENHITKIVTHTFA